MSYDLLRLVPVHRAIVSAIKVLFPDETDDDLSDSIAGASNLPDAIVAVLRNAIEREAMGKAIGELIDGMTARRRRLDDGAKSLRGTALYAMLEAALPKIKAADMSVSVGHGKPRVVIVDADQIPDHLCRVIREPSKSAIGIELAAGRDVPGATLGNSVAFIAVHRG